MTHSNNVWYFNVFQLVFYVLGLGTENMNNNKVIK